MCLEDSNQEVMVLESSTESRDEEKIQDSKRRKIGEKSIEQKTDGKYKIIFHRNSYEKIFYMDDDDPIESLYKALFKENTKRKLLYEESKLSLYLKAGESGFFPGTNYITVPDDDLEEVGSEIQVIIMYGDDEKDRKKINIDGKKRIKDLQSEILEVVKKENLNGRLVFNGTPLNGETEIAQCLESGYILDLV